MKKIECENMKRIIGLIGIMMILLSAIVSATNYYVDSTNGNDANDGKLTANAWKTVSKANSVLIAGDTVYIMNGLYREQIRPAHSGSAGNPIVYKNYPGHAPTLTGLNWPIWFPIGINYIVVDGINVDGGDRLTTPLNHAAWVQGDYDVIQNCVFKNGNNNTDGGVRLLGNYGKLINCTVSHFGYYGIGDVWVEGTYNLVEGCYIEDIGHDCINNFGYHNIIRNNDLYNPIYRVADACHSGGSGARGYLVFEGNRVYGSPILGMQANSPYGVIRRNFVYNNGQHGLGIYGSPPSMGDPSHLRIYQNTFYNNGGSGIQLNQNGVQPTDIVIENNIAYKNIGNFPYYYNVDPANQHEINNFVGDPSFVSESSLDFHLTSSSACIDQGAWLTTTASAGSGTSIPVVDAGYFIDGFGIVEGDIIQLQGQANNARITSINYDTNTFTVNISLTWTFGLGVSLAYSGSAPDIGAYEYVSGSPSQPVPGDLNGDGKVDVSDLSIVALDFGKTSGLINSKSDTNGDNIVDIFDIVYVASRFT